MQIKMITGLFAVMVLTACGNGDRDEDYNDSANVLTDTLPAMGYPADSVAIGIDSNPADATKVDPLAQ